MHLSMAVGSDAERVLAAPQAELAAVTELAQSWQLATASDPQPHVWRVRHGASGEEENLPRAR